MAHGCQAGLQQEAWDEVFFARVVRRNEKYSKRKLGAFGSDLGAVACFFATPWSQLSPAFADLVIQAFLFDEAGFTLRALGRSTESLEPMRATVTLMAKAENWMNAALGASNLSELELTLGDVAAAMGDAEQSVIYADRSNSGVIKAVSARIRLADAQLAAGKTEDAIRIFAKAEGDIAAEYPAYRWLIGNWGFRYDEARLVSSERLAWFRTLAANGLRPLREIALLKATFDLAAKRLSADEKSNQPLFDIALDHLTLGHTALYRAILENSDLRVLTSDLSHIDAAVAGLRRSGRSDTLPGGLLTRAWLRFLTDARTGSESAQEDLDEAWEIAERGLMRLFMADIHLYRARLFHAVKPYPWNKNPDGTERGPKDDLAEARKLIEQCGYWRRKEELEDAEAAAKNW